VTRKQEIGPILVANCGTVMTRTMLLDRVLGEYRMVAQGEAPTTRAGSQTGLMDGVRQAIRQISEVTNRRFLDGDGDLITPQKADGEGVDAFSATVSASEPLKIVLGGLGTDLSIASARRAAAGTYSRVEAVLNDDRGVPLDDEGCVRTIRDAAADVVCIAGGTEDGAARPVLDIVEAVTLACSMMARETRPTLLYAGNSRLRRDVAKIVGDEAELRVVENVRPTLDHEYLLDAQHTLATLFRERKLSTLPGLTALRDWTRVPVDPAGQAFGRLIQYLWHLGDPERGVLGIDVGAANTTVAAVFDETLHLTIHSGLGATFGGERLLDNENSESITRWLPERLSRDEVRGLLIQKASYPTSIPQVERELWLDHALAREAIREALEIARPGWQAKTAQPYPELTPLCDTIVVGGGVLAQAPHGGQAALILLDALQPIGISTLVLDRYGLTPVLGNVARVKPVAAVEALDAGGLTNLGTVVAPVGEARPGDRVMAMTVRYDNGSELDVDVRYGDLEILPLPLGQEAVLELSPRRGFDVGLGGRGKKGKRRVSGGLAGLIIDARGRPLRLPPDPEIRQEQIQEWLWEVGG